MSALHAFPGGLCLPANKERSTALPIQQAPLAQRYIVPLGQHMGVPARPCVEVGQAVLKGQTIALPDGTVSAALHAPTSGTVVAIGAHPYPHASGLPALAIVVADGLSALAVQRHTLPFLERLEEQALAEGWSLSPVVLVEQGRVAVADEIGELLRAKMSVILIGERPGLSSPDSLGLYFTWAPRVGLTDAYRNCISNVRLEGLSYGMAAHRLLYLMREACRRQLSGVNLKDEAEVQALEGEAPRTGNFLLARD